MNEFHLPNTTNLVDIMKRGSNGLLTRKEAIIARYLTEDYTITDIAELLCRPRNTVEMHIENIKKKCRCETVTKLEEILHGFIKNNQQEHIINERVIKLLQVDK